MTHDELRALKTFIKAVAKEQVFRASPDAATPAYTNAIKAITVARELAEDYLDEVVDRANNSDSHS